MPGCGCAAGGATRVPVTGPPRGFQSNSSYLPPPPKINKDIKRVSKTPNSVAYDVPDSQSNANDDRTTPQVSMEPSQSGSKPTWKSPLKAFDTFATKVLKQKVDAEEDFPKLTMPSFRGLHKCKVAALNLHHVDMSIELEQELRNIGIQGTQMMEQLEKLLKAEASCQFQGAVRAAELAAMAAPTGLAEEAAVAASRGYSVEAQQFSRMATGENPIEIVGYIGCTRPDNF